MGEDITKLKQSIKNIKKVIKKTAETIRPKGLPEDSQGKSKKT